MKALDWEIIALNLKIIETHNASFYCMNNIKIHENTSLNHHLKHAHGIYNFKNLKKK